MVVVKRLKFEKNYRIPNYGILLRWLVTIMWLYLNKGIKKQLLIATGRAIFGTVRNSKIHMRPTFSDRKRICK